MGRPPKEIAELHAKFSMPPLKQYWAAINRATRAQEAEERAK